MQVVDSLKSHDSTTNSQYVTLLDFIHELSKDDKETIARMFTYLDLDADALRVRKELLEAAKILKISDPKIARRMAVSLFNDRDVEMFMTYLHRFRRYVKRLVLSKNYMMVILQGEMEIGGKTKRLTRKYVIGVNDFRDTLFINEVNTLISKYTIYFGNDGIAYEYTDDGDFREVFGYTEDVIEPRTTLGIGSGDIKSFRVSGEVVFELYSNVDYYVERIFKFSAYRYIAYIASDVIARLLLDNGFNIPASPEFVGTIPDTVRIRVPGAVTRHTNLEKAMEAFRRLLKDYFTVEMYNDRIAISTEDFMVVLDLDTDFRFGESRGDLLINMFMPVGSDTESKKYYVDIMSDIKKNVEELLNSEQRFTTYVGNHLIRLENALPVNLTYEPKIKPVFYPPISITVFNPMEFIVTPKSKVTIEHVEHGNREITFDDTYVLRVRTTTVANDYIEKRNVLALRRLMTQYT